MSNGMSARAQGVCGNDQLAPPQEKQNKWSLTPFLFLISLLGRVLMLVFTPFGVILGPAFADSSPQFAYCGIGSLSTAMAEREQYFSAMCNNPDNYPVLGSCVWKDELFTSGTEYGSYEQGWIRYVIGYGPELFSGAWTYVYCADPAVKDSGPPNCPNKVGNPVNS